MSRSASHDGFGTPAKIFFYGWLAVQLAVPVARQGREHPTRFAWDMFSHVRPRPVLVVESLDGTLNEATLVDFLGFEREDLDYEDADLGAVCRRVAGAVRVTLRWEDGRLAAMETCASP